MDKNRLAYNKIADQWAESRDHSPLSKVVVDFADKVKPKGEILDIGCGTGYPIMSFLSERGFIITGIDITENLLKKAIERKIPNTTLQLCDFFDFSPVGKFDGIVAFDSFFHFPKSKQREIYSRLSEWINDDGYVLFTHGNREGEISGEMFNETFYYSCLDTREVHELLSNNGFEVISSIEFYTEYNLDRDLVIIAKKIR